MIFGSLVPIVVFIHFLGCVVRPVKQEISTWFGSILIEFKLIVSSYKIIIIIRIKEMFCLCFFYIWRSSRWLLDRVSLICKYLTLPVFLISCRTSCQVQFIVIIVLVFYQTCTFLDFSNWICFIESLIFF